MSVIIKSGFQKVNTGIFRRESLVKDEGLLKTNHVTKVSELVDTSSKLIIRKVLRETPGSKSKINNTNFYDVKVELNAERVILDTHCECKAERGFCKHAAAVCLFVNLENTLFKTDQPMLWNKPSDAQLAKYNKGCTIDALYPPKSIVPGLYKVYKFNEVENITNEHLQEDCNMIRMIKSELQCSAEKTEKEALTKEEEKAKKIIEQLLGLQQKSCFPIYCNYEVMENNSCSDKIKFKVKYKFDADDNNNKKDLSLITVDEKKCFEICLLSTSQSGCSLWYRERYIRITCSSRAHRIKTRKDESNESFMKLAEKFINEKHQESLTKKMLYGKRMEAHAKRFFEKLTELKVQEIGLFISTKQPFLACSPDGIIINGYNYELLEIKCPASCENSMIVNREEQKCFVSYLFYADNGNLLLKNSSVYYTQIQVSMYILCISVCHFFVYSSVDQVYIKVPRDEEFLSQTVPKIEKFYCDFFFSFLTNSFTD